MKTTETGDRSLLCAVTRAGTGSPLYIVPSVGMTALSLINLARSIDPPRPIYSFEFAGMEDERRPHDNIEDMAGAYVAEIRRHQPAGPFYIGGHCFGGCVAHDMVTKLEAIGERVAVLVLFDAIGPAAADDGAQPNAAADQGLPTSGEMAGHVEKALGLLGEHAAKQFSVLPAPAVERFEAIIRAHVVAGLQYWGAPVETRIALLRTGTHDGRAFHGWRSIGTGGYSEAEVPGDTFSMLKPPHARVLGQRLSEILNALK
jgi:thioesterase domain-containing protein